MAGRLLPGRWTMRWGRRSWLAVASVLMIGAVGAATLPADEPLGPPLRLSAQPLAPNVDAWSEANGAAGLGAQLVAYVEYDPIAGAGALVVTATDGTVDNVLVTAEADVFLDVAWSPDRSTLAYTAGRYSTVTELFVVPAGGGEPRLLAAHGGGAVRTPVWSPDGSTLAFTRQYPDGSGAPFLIAADGSRERPLVDPTTYELEPDWACGPVQPTNLMAAGWSPDGTSVLLHAMAICAEEVFADVAMVEVDGTGLRQIGDLQGTELNPRWSPDGSLIAFEGPEGLYVIGADGTGLTLLGPGLNPRWAPSSDELAFVRASDPVDESTYDVWAVAPSASASARQVESSAVGAGAPQWSGDGTVIGFVGSESDATELYFVAATGGEPVLGSNSGGANVLAFAFQPSLTRRISGPDRYETAAAIARASFADGTSAAAVLARGDTFPDALAGAHLAGYHGPGPVLLTEPQSLHPAALAELERRTAGSAVFLLGDVEAIGAAVEADLEGRGFAVERVGGPDRYSTARLVAATAPDGSTTAFVTSGEQFADAMSAGPWAYPAGGPQVLLTPADALHPETRLAIGERGVREILLLGGTDAVSAEVEAELRSTCDLQIAASPCPAVQRIAGSDRAETATLLADHFAEQRGAPFTHVNLARGDTFPDALAGAPHGGGEEAPILFTQSSTELGATTRAWLRAHADEIDSIHVFGGTQAVSDAVFYDAREAATAG